MRRTFLITTVITASVVIAACDGAGSPTAPSGAQAGPDLSRSAARSGPMNVQKDCTDYRAQAGDHCTITSSNVDAIPVGSVITYAKGAVGVLLDTDVIVDPPGRGQSVAFGHCALDLSTGVGRCTLSGGTGKYKHFRASVAVSHVVDNTFAWDGTYSFGGKGGEK